MPAIEWLPWSAGAFARARAEHKPILLSIAASWCGRCEEMDRTSYADAHVATLVRERFIPVRVDADRQPDISERYSLGGWPTTAFLTGDGDIAGGGTFVPQDRLAGVLARVADTFVARQDEIAARASAARLRPSPDDDPDTAPCDLLRTVVDAYDPEHGGFGGAPKFPLTGPIHLALDLYRESADARWAEIAVTTLDAIGWGPLHDDEGGGFFRCAAGHDWSQPQGGKLLDVNARLLTAFLDGADALGVARFDTRAADTLRFVQTTFADLDEGGWTGSQRAEARAGSRFEAGSDLACVDPATYADANALMASAALRASARLDDRGLRDFALMSLERVVLACYEPGRGVAHYSLDGLTGSVRLLADQVAMAAAHLDAHAATGNIAYEMMAEELAYYMLAALWDEKGGGFFDRTQEPDAVGLLRDRRKPFAGNCDAARMLRRLGSVSGQPEFARAADATIAAVSPAARHQGPLAAHLLLAVREPLPR